MIRVYVVTNFHHSSNSIHFPEIKETNVIPLHGEVFGNREAAERYRDALMARAI